MSALAEGQDLRIGPEHKSFPPAWWGRPAAALMAATEPLASWQTPILALDRGGLTANTRTMFDWLDANGLQLSPHGKTTMAPALWNELLEAGAWGITFATIWQLQIARAHGVTRMMLANAALDPVGLRWLSAELDAHPDADIVSWADSVATVDAMTEVLVPLSPARPIPVIVELGGTSGRTGARTVDEALDVAHRIANSPVLQLAGVGGYEGALAHDRSEASIAIVDAYLDEIVLLHRAIVAERLYEAPPIVTAGGSAYFDRVADRFEGLVAEASVVLRSGAFQVHDDGFYRGITPMGSLLGPRAFRPAMHAWVRVVSRPEPGLALCDAGKRDLPFDEGMPEAQRVIGLDDAESAAILGGSAVTAMNDQHLFLRLSPERASADVLPVGSVIRLGLSHPCTAFDKWRLIPIVDDSDADEPRVVDLVQTWF